MEEIRDEITIHKQVFLSSFAFAISVGLTFFYRDYFKKTDDESTWHYFKITMVAFITTAISMYVTYLIFGNVF